MRKVVVIEHDVDGQITLDDLSVIGEAATAADAVKLARASGYKVVDFETPEQIPGELIGDDRNAWSVGVYAAEMAPTYYVIKTEYVGPNADDDQHADDDKIVISSVPARYNMGSRGICIQGWCGTTSDRAIYAHGEYDSLDAAQTAITEKFGDVRLSDPDWTDEETDIEVYRPGRYAPLGRQSTLDWAEAAMSGDIKASTADEEIDELVAEYEGYANNEGLTLDREALERGMTERRNELRDDD